MIKLTQNQIAEMFSCARQALPHECCGLLGGRGRMVSSLYKLTNIAENPRAEYEAAPADLFRAQKKMRDQNETLIGIYHSHPLESDPAPSATDVRRAFYPQAIYFIVGCAGDEYVLRAFRLYESERRWERAEFAVIE